MKNQIYLLFRSGSRLRAVSPREHRTVEQQAGKLEEQEGTIERLKALIATQEKVAVQQKQIDRLTTELRKVNDRVELINSSPRLWRKNTNKNNERTIHEHTD